jgi:hypothetical protein
VAHVNIEIKDSSVTACSAYSDKTQLIIYSVSAPGVIADSISMIAPFEVLESLVAKVQKELQEYKQSVLEKSKQIMEQEAPPTNA